MNLITPVYLNHLISILCFTILVVGYCFFVGFGRLRYRNNIITRFFSMGLLGQILSIVVLGIVLVGFFGGVFSSYRTSLRLLLDPSSVFEIEDIIKFILAFVEVILGMLLLASLLSAITNNMINLSEKQRLHSAHKVLKEAFEVHNPIKTRELLAKHNIQCRLRMFSLQETETRLELAREDVINAIQSYGELRLRLMKTTQQVVLEDFFSNTEYGSFVNRNSNLTIVSTQNFSDAGAGHYSATLSKILNANYISNEFFSSGSPLKNKQVNFASNEAFLVMTPKNVDHSAIKSLITDIREINNQTDLYIYIGTANNEYLNDVHLLFGGEFGETFDVTNSTYNDIGKLKAICSDAAPALKAIGYTLGTHEEKSNSKKSDLSNSIHRNFNKNVLAFHISTKILWSADDPYYKSLLILAEMIKQC